MRVVLVSTYDLGRQPFGLASPAAWLREAGAEVVCADLSRSPLPEAAVVRSVVINGREQDVRTMPIPFPVRADTLYLVRMEVRGQDFTTYIQNQVVDHFSDSRLKQGGVGFFSPKGDRALLRWVEVSHQYDYLGRLCALLAPYGVQNFANN